MSFFKRLFGRKSKELKVIEYEPFEEDIRPKRPNNKWSNLKPINTNLIKQVDFPKEHYFQAEHPKNQIVLHHTVSGKGVSGDINHWLSMSSRIATCIIVDHDGIAHQCFLSKYWAHHLGVRQDFLRQRGFSDWQSRNTILNRESIAIEIDNWGGLVLGDGTTKQFGDRFVQTKRGEYYAAYGNIVRDIPIIHYPDGYRGYYYYEKYTDEQIKTVGELLLYWNKFYNIPLGYNENMWEVNNDALGGKRGVWSHTSYRTDKSDCHPQPELIEMLRTLRHLT